MKLREKGYLRRLQGSSMGFGNFDTKIENLQNIIGEDKTLAVPDSFITINEVGENYCRFTFRFFDKAEEHHINLNETVIIKHEGNAFGFEIQFILEE